MADENEMWFTDSPDEFSWGSVTFQAPEPEPVRGREPKGPRMSVADWIALYEEDQGPS